MLVILVAIPIVHNKMAKKKYLVWKDDYSVGIEEMDNDHKKLLNLINQLQTAVNYYTGKEFEEKALNELVDYTKTHFKKEEQLMADNGYEDLEAHKQQHKRFISKINDFIIQYKSDSDITIVDTLQFLKEWLIKHINGTDKEYGKVLNDKGIH
ncbi:bacteriohemerythrin [sulfur-oxidizing endosymbiont of Gigantopelta aegis]|uniref:bacteriohemerythrin n=1 Tax=sulfur-oxidizing endosymbiont of Gigantopelta aegis TaxID=2794934 RepID=UPI0018DC87EB|nr:bacteriohemerythrin [sulfur-oxidizing endosymbiont of Gigantopelta aegis]